MSKHKQPRAGFHGPDEPDFAFEPVIVRKRHDGWTAERQMTFIQALAESGCVTEACARVGMSVNSAYALRTRLDAQRFRFAWEAALDHAIQRLSDAAFSRALNGVARPVFFQGEQIGERRYYDENLTRFLLRYRDPIRYGKSNDQHIFERDDPDAVVLDFSRLLLRMLKDGHAYDAGEPLPKHEPYRPRLSMVEEIGRFWAQFETLRNAHKPKADHSKTSETEDWDWEAFMKEVEAEDVDAEDEGAEDDAPVSSSS